MHLHFQNVNDAFHDLVRRVDLAERRGNGDQSGVLVGRRPSRYGDTLTVEEPVLVTYSCPRERVLFNEARDANPFMHLMEALWMLAGRNDVAPLAYYAKRMAEFSDDDRTLNGAYGYRWRHHQTDIYDDQVGPDPLEVDQLDLLVSHLKDNPTSRRAVLQMWNVEDDLLKIGGGPLPVCDCGADRSGPSAEAHSRDCPASKPVRTDGSKDLGSKDVCCNLSVMFSLRFQGARETTTTANERYRTHVPIYSLDMTVTNRSNDMIWGMLGADYVHFTFLQEYVAARLGAEVGLYHHFTNNLHVYTDNWKPEEWLKWYEDRDGSNVGWLYTTTNGRPRGRMIPLVSDPGTFERELPLLVGAYGTDEPRGLGLEFKEPFLAGVAQPMLEAFRAYKLRGAGVMSWVAKIQADDWKASAESWLSRRLERRELRKTTGGTE